MKYKHDYSRMFYDEDFGGDKQFQQIRLRIKAKFSRINEFWEDASHLKLIGIGHWGLAFRRLSITVLVKWRWRCWTDCSCSCSGFHLCIPAKCRFDLKQSKMQPKNSSLNWCIALGAGAPVVIVRRARFCYVSMRCVWTSKLQFEAAVLLSCIFVSEFNGCGNTGCIG